MKPVQILKFVSTFIGFLFVGWLSFVRPDWLLKYAYFTCIPGYLLIAFILTPAHRIRLGTAPALPLTKWFLKVLSGQLILLFFSFCAAIAFFKIGPSFSLDQINVVDAKMIIQNQGIWWGIFPWGIVGFWGFCIAYITYLKQGAPYYYQIAREHTPRWLQPVLKTYAEGTSSGATILILCLMTVVVIVLIAAGIELLIGIHHYRVPMISISILFMLSPVVFLKFFRKRFHKWTRRITLSQVIAFCLIFFISLLIFAAYMNEWMIARHPELYELQCEQCQNYFVNIPMEYRFAALFWGWWFLWTPLCGSYLARISQGRTLLQFILGIYFVPLILTLIYFIFGTNLFEGGSKYLIEGYRAMLSFLPITSAQMPIYEKAIFLIILGSLSGILLLIITWPFRDNKVLNSGVMPVSETTEKGRYWLYQGSKTTGIGKESHKVIMTVLGTLVLHTYIGWYGIQIQVVAMGVLVLNAIYVGIDFIILWFFKDQFWAGNLNIIPFVKRSMQNSD